MIEETGRDVGFEEPGTGCGANWAERDGGLGICLTGVGVNGDAIDGGENPGQIG